MVKISRRNVISALIVVLVWLSFVISGSHALLSDSATLTGNTLIVGSVGLLVSNSQNPSSTIYEKSRQGFSFSLVPGQPVDRYFLLKNISDSNVDLAIDFMPQITTDNPSLDPQLTLDIVPVDADGVPLPDATEVGGSMMALSQRHTVVNGTISQGTYQRYRLRTVLSSAFSEPQQTITYDLIFTGTQKVS